MKIALIILFISWIY